MRFTVIFSLIHGSVAISGTTLNAILLYLAIFKTPNNIRSYSVLIQNFALIDFIACLSDFFVQQRHIPTGTTLAYVSYGYCKFFGPDACYFGYSIMLHCLSHSLWSLLFSFSYRLYILSHSAPSRSTLTKILVLIYIPSLIQCISYLWANDNPDEIRKILTQKYPQYNFTGEVVTGNKDIFHFSAMYTILHMSLPITPVCICILFLRRKIIQKLSFQGINITKDTRNLHSQLLTALTYQASIPGFYLFAIVSYSIGQFEIYHHPILECFTCFTGLLNPFLSPLTSLIFVTPYRNFVLNKIKWNSKIGQADRSVQQITNRSSGSMI